MECMRDNFKDGVLLDGRYQTISALNHGSFGMVFRALDTKTGETVAIKCLTKRTANTDAFMDFAIDDKSEEQQLMARLGSHPNIVNLLNAFETDAHVYLVIEFCPQGDLYEAIRNDQGPLETEHVREFMFQLVDAVAYMHSKGVYHRDIKPENIFLMTDGAMKLGDFGLATTEKWTMEATVGSDRYMSPEQYDSAGAGYSPAQADIWAVGIVLLNVLFSRNPFITPSEEDPLFLDFSRDKQSLFDVFPSMSTDTYNVIVECMNLDPSKRSLDRVRDALDRVVSFTTTDEDVDDFLQGDLPQGAVPANREPLRTPSIQSPQIDNGGAFPWAKHLQASPHHVRTLSIIPDNESYSEELFSQSANTTGWCSTATAETPSMASMLESSLAGSMHSLAISARPGLSRLDAKVSPMAGSLPIAMTRPKQNAMSLVFGRKDVVSKSWSDMWDEDEEAEEQQHVKQTQLKELNSRTWSHESKADDDNTPRPGQSPATKLSILSTAKPDVSSIDQTIKIVEDDSIDHFAGGPFVFEEPPVEEKSMENRPALLSTYKPPSKRDAADKWAALGERRRAHSRTPASPFAKLPDTTPKSTRTGNTLGYRFGSHGHGQLDHFNATQHYNNHSSTSYSLFSSPTPNNHHGYGQTKNSIGKDHRAKGCPWNEGREWATPRREKRHDMNGDLEWVGGWQQAHH